MAEQLRELLTEQTRQCQSHIQAVLMLEDSLKYQLEVRKNGRVPDVFLPKQLSCENQSLVMKFVSDYKNLFLDHLDKVIMDNTASITMHNISIKDILTTTDRQLLKIKMAKNELKRQYDMFMKKNNTVNHRTLPELQAYLNKDNFTCTTLTHTQKRALRRKRQKESNCQPDTQKHPRLAESNFLWEGLSVPQKPP